MCHEFNLSHRGIELFILKFLLFLESKKSCELDMWENWIKRLIFLFILCSFRGYLMFYYYFIYSVYDINKNIANFSPKSGCPWNKHESGGGGGSVVIKILRTVAIKDSLLMKFSFIF